MSHKENKKVSIVLPVYNGEKVLAEAIESVLNQTYQNIELIIVNDCSTDQTEKIINVYVEKDSRVKKINNFQNMKLPASLNVGFQNATGEYWTWTSDDNKYKPEAIECMTNYLEKNLLTCMVYADYTAIDASGNEMYKQTVSEPENIVMGNCIGACFLYRREYAQKAGLYDTNLFLAEDYDYWIRLYKEGPISHLNKDLYYYRKHEKSLTATKQGLIEMQTYRVWEKNFLFLFSMLKTVKQKIEFMDKMLFWASGFGEGKKKKIVEMLCCVYKRYRLHVWYRNIRHMVSTTIIGDAWRKFRDR